MIMIAQTVASSGTAYLDAGPEPQGIGDSGQECRLGCNSESLIIPWLGCIIHVPRNRDELIGGGLVRVVDLTRTQYVVPVEPHTYTCMSIEKLD